MSSALLTAATGFMPASYDPPVVAASFGIALLASYVTLDLARRVRTSERRSGLAWWVAGSVVMGSGMWSMHFLGMQAFRLPIALGFTSLLTLLSWLAAVGASGIALALASMPAFRRRHLVWGALAMGGGISAMHYIGMQALDMSLPIVWRPWVVGASVLIAVLASASALALFQLLRKVHGPRRPAFQMLASVVMAAAICGMHYTGMAAADFPLGTVCTSANALGGSGLTAVIVLATGMLLISTLFTSILDARLQSTARALTRSLQESNDQLTRANAALQKQAFADPLTGLPNRLLFEDRLAQALLRLDRANHRKVTERLGVLFVDLDGFKPMNDSFGHAFGDAILAQAAQRLHGDARDSDTVARVGGDEFVLLLENVGSVPECGGVAERILASMAQPFDLAGRQVQISCSIGVVVYPDHGERDKLMAHADAAMYAAKRAGGNGYALFEESMRSDATNLLELKSDLRRALGDASRQLALHYQPKIDGARGGARGVEALLRWQHPTRGPVSPSVFIALAERSGLINPLGNWVIDEACRQIAEWHAQGLQMPVAINLSVHQLRETGLARRIAQALQEHGVDPSQLLCEITESVAMEDTQATQRTLEELERIGISLSIDDFGTGHSSLSYLRRMPVQQLKIDRSFVADLEHQEDARAVVDAVVRLAHALGLRVVAEGVETQGQRDILRAMQCDELQGFLFARPMPADALLDWARSHTAGAWGDTPAPRAGPAAAAA